MTATVILPDVRGSGQREGWWFHVTGLVDNLRHRGFRRFKGARLAAGVCELPEMAVVLLVRPVGTQRDHGRLADVMHVDADKGELVGVAYGLAWEGCADSAPLRHAVSSALEHWRSRSETPLNLKGDPV